MQQLDEQTEVPDSDIPYDSVVDIIKADNPMTLTVSNHSDGYSTVCYGFDLVRGIIPDNTLMRAGANITNVMMHGGKMTEEQCNRALELDIADAIQAK